MILFLLNTRTAPLLHAFCDQLSSVALSRLQHLFDERVQGPRALPAAAPLVGRLQRVVAPVAAAARVVVLLDELV